MATPQIELENISFHYEASAPILKDIHWKVQKGSRTALIGANGAGKSTLLMHLNGLLRPATGSIKVNGSLVKYRSADLRELRRKVGYVFQNPDQQLVAPTVVQDLGFGPLNLGLDPKEVSRRVAQVVVDFRLEAILNHPVYALSYGQKKRVSLAGVMAMDPEVLILDEPTLGLDVFHQNDLESRLTALSERGKTVLLSTHDFDLIGRWADEVVVLDQGRVIAQGTPWTILANKELLGRVLLRPYWVAELSLALGLSTLDQKVILEKVRSQSIIGH